MVFEKITDGFQMEITLGYFQKKPNENVNVNENENENGNVNENEKTKP